MPLPQPLLLLLLVAAMSAYLAAPFFGASLSSDESESESLSESSSESLSLSEPLSELLSSSLSSSVLVTSSSSSSLSDPAAQKRDACSAKRRSVHEGKRHGLCRSIWEFCCFGSNTAACKPNKAAVYSSIILQLKCDTISCRGASHHASCSCCGGLC